MNFQFDIPVRVVCATRATRAEFLSNTPTGFSIKSYIKTSEVEVRLYPENKIGLGELYNKAILECIDNPALLVFIHDDIWIGDFFWADRIRAGLQDWDIVGVAGNKRRVLRQPSWNFINDQFEWDDLENLTGVIGHGRQMPPTILDLFGPFGQECKLLDGLILAVNSQTLLSSGLRFDEGFKFHFYDMDFCRQAEVFNLRMGTIPLSLVHESAGNFGSDDWNGAYKQYTKKWNE